ncbi:hypothetical protein ACWGGS_26730 [Streptomyces decoyicus]
MDDPRGTMMRKDTCIPGIPALRLCRTSLTALMVVLGFLLGGAATASGAAKSAFTAPSPVKSASAPPAAEPDHDGTEKKAKREAERGQPRRTARLTVGIPQHIGRPLPPFGEGVKLPVAAMSSGVPSAGSTTKAASRPAEIPLLHCVFRC